MKIAYQLLSEARKLIDTPEKWTQDAIARNVDNQVTALSDASACKFCMYGALMKSAGLAISNAYLGVPAVDELDAVHELRVALALLSKQTGGESVGRFNDTVSHGQALAAFDGAIKVAKDR